MKFRMQLLLCFSGILLVIFGGGCSLVMRRVEVVDADTGDPIAGASVLVYESRGYLLGNYTTRLGYKTDNEGIARVARAVTFLSSGQVSAMAEGYLPVASLETGDVVLELIPRKAISGIVFGRGRVGIDEEGEAFGFDFLLGRESYDLEQCDLVIDSDWIKSSERPNVYGPKAFVRNGCVAVAKLIPGIPREYLIHQEREAPITGYSKDALLFGEPASEKGLYVYFFVTRDGCCYGKIVGTYSYSTYATGAFELSFDWVLQSNRGDRRLDCPHSFLLACPYPFSDVKYGQAKVDNIDWQE